MSAQARREQVDFAVSRGASVRRACALMDLSRVALKYRSRMPKRDAELALELKRISTEHPTFGYRFAWGLLRNGKWHVNRKRVRRLWRQLELAPKPHRRCRKIRTGIARDLEPTGPNQVWAYDFVHDTCSNGQGLKALTVVDEWTRECHAIEVATKIDAVKVIAVLGRLFARFGTPAVLRSDNGPEFIARALRLWAMENHSDIATIEPGKPWQNGCVESFNGTFRAECLDREWFSNLFEARIVIEKWRTEYNTLRPHSSLDYHTPASIGIAARSALGQKSTSHEIVDPVASLEAAIGQMQPEVHPITIGTLS